jgi:hypothetical protein
MILFENSPSIQFCHARTRYITSLFLECRAILDVSSSRVIHFNLDAAQGRIEHGSGGTLERPKCYRNGTELFMGAYQHRTALSQRARERHPEKSRFGGTGGNFTGLSAQRQIPSNSISKSYFATNRTKLRIAPGKGSCKSTLTIQQRQGSIVKRRPKDGAEAFLDPTVVPS